MKRVLVSTFGCKLNQYDSQVISGSFASEGYELASDLLDADICVVNTCSVTRRSDYEARQLVRRILRANPRALVLVTGCYAQRAPREIVRLGGVGLVAGNAEKSSLPRFVESLGGSAEARVEVGSTDIGEHAETAAREASCLPAFQRRARALLKIQDGCDGRCSYCVVPAVRGRSRSRPVSLMREEAGRLAASGFREVVLTGARVGSYGKDSGSDCSLLGLLKLLIRDFPSLRFRLSSLEPGEIDASLIEYAIEEKRVCRHFHVPMQSGDAAVLSAMRRPYTPLEYAEKILMIHHSLPDACLGSDVIAGFPGETETQFNNTYELIDKLPLSYLHVFPFSRRPGTPAWQMGGEPIGPVKRNRARALRELGAKKRLAFFESQVGASGEVVLEEEVEPGFFKGTTSNYLRVLVRAEGKGVRDSINVRISGRAGSTMLAHAC